MSQPAIIEHTRVIVTGESRVKCPRLNRDGTGTFQDLCRESDMAVIDKSVARRHMSTGIACRERDINLRSHHVSIERTRRLDGQYMERRHDVYLVRAVHGDLRVVAYAQASECVAHIDLHPRHTRAIVSSYIGTIRQQHVA